MENEEKNHQLNSTANVDFCFHCGLPVKDDSFKEEIKGKEQKFCCNGCLTACLIIHSVGADGYYKTRTSKPEKIVKNLSKEFLFDSDNFEKKYISEEDGLSYINLYMEDMHCPSCVWVVEKVSQNTQGIKDVSVNFTSKTAKIKWNKNEVTLDKIFQTLGGVGYQAKPVEKNTLSSISSEINKNLMIRMAVSGFGAMATMFLAEPFYFDYIQDLDHTSAMLLEYLSLIITTPIFVYTINPFLKGFLSSLKFKLLTMDSTIFIGASLIYFYSLWNIINQKTPVYFDCLTMFIFLILLGRFIESSVKQQVFIKVEQNLRNYPQKAIIIKNEHEIIVDTEEIELNDTVIIKTGEQIPVDGEIVFGSGNINESIITGESIPLFKKEGDKVIAGSINVDGLIYVKTEKSAGNTTINKIVELTDILKSKRGNFQRLSDKIGNVLILLSFAIALGSYLYNANSNHEFALLSAISVIIATCPCALGLAMPAAISIATSYLLKKGILFKDPDSFEKISKMNNLILDKTGTITSGKLEFLSITVANDFSENDVIKYASSVSRYSEHPVSFAIVSEANKRKVELKKASNYKSILGKGLYGESDGFSIILGNTSFLKENNIENLPENANSMTEVLIAINNKFAGIIIFSDKIKEDSQDMVDYFKNKKISISLLSGDKKNVVKDVSTKLGITDYQGEFTPQDKAEYIKNMKHKNIICMVGDGINDTPAMAQADIGVSLSSTNDLAKIKSDIIILNNNASSLKEMFRVSERTYQIIKQNMLISLIYNIIVIPLAVTGNITPFIASLLMPFSSICVLLNSLRIIKDK